MHDYNDTKEFIDVNIIGSGYGYGDLSSCYGADVEAAVVDFILARLAEKGITSGSIGITCSGVHRQSEYRYAKFAERIEQSGANFTVNELLGGADYSAEDRWRVVLDTPIITLDGGGTSGIDYYKDILARTHEYFGE